MGSELVQSWGENTQTFVVSSKMSCNSDTQCSMSTQQRKSLLLIKQNNVILASSSPPTLDDREEYQSTKRKWEKETTEEHTCSVKQRIDKCDRKWDSIPKQYKQLLDKEAKIVVEKINFKEVLITTPSKGVREIHYFSLPSDDDSEDEDETDDDTRSLTAKVKYEDWRVQTIRAFPTTKKRQTEEDDSECSSGEYFLEVPSSQDYIFRVDYARDDLHSILDILGGDKMSTQIIDGYFMLRLKRYYAEFEEMARRRLIKAKRRCSYTLRKNQQSSKKAQDPLKIQQPTNFQYLSVNFMPVKDRDDPVSKFRPNLKYLPDLAKLWDKNNPVQLIAPLYASKHLYLAVFDVQAKQVYAYDSSWHYLPMPLREGQIQAILSVITKSNNKIKRDDGKDDAGNHEEMNDAFRSASKWKINFVSTSCPQYDEYSCGIFTIHYAENVLRGVAHDKNRWQLSNNRVMQIRRCIVKELLFTTAYGRRFLEAVSE